MLINSHSIIQKVKHSVIILSIGRNIHTYVKLVQLTFTLNQQQCVNKIRGGRLKREGDGVQQRGNGSELYCTLHKRSIETNPKNQSRGFSAGFKVSLNNGD